MSIFSSSDLAHLQGRRDCIANLLLVNCRPYWREGHTKGAIIIFLHDHAAEAGICISRLSPKGCNDIPEIISDIVKAEYIMQAALCDVQRRSGVLCAYGSSIYSEWFRLLAWIGAHMTLVSGSQADSKYFCSFCSS